MKKLPFFSQSTQMMVVDLLCRCGAKWSDHNDDVEGGEIHGGECNRTACQRFTFASYMYEQAKVDCESIRQEVIFKFLNPRSDVLQI